MSSLPPPRPFAPKNHPGPHGPDCPGRSCRLQHWAPKSVVLTDEILTAVREGLALAESADEPYPDPWEFIRTVRERQAVPVFLYEKSQWLLEAEAWLPRFGSAVIAAGLPWISPRMDRHQEGPWLFWHANEILYLLIDGEEPAFHYRRAGQAPYDQHDTASRDDIPACVELYRRWLGGRSGT